MRSHYLPLFSRLGDYEPGVLEDAAYGRDRILFEYWGHEASLLPLAAHPLLRWRMERARSGEGTWGRLARLRRDNPHVLERVLARLAHEGPLGAGAFEGPRGEGGWWGWSEAKNALEALFWSGEITTRTRRGFERIYDLTERVIPAEILALPTPGEADAQRELVRTSARAMGIASERDLRDYFRLDLADARARVAELVESGELTPVTVESLRGTRYLAPGTRVPRRVHAHALLSPFDSLVWNRDRTRELFGFDYRIEIYVPRHKRVHGYYVLPFLFGDRLMARVDLKHDRQARILRAHATHLEHGVPRREVLAAVRTQLESMAHWLGADKVTMR
ncbi:MAG TPA: crosslink repair DNA glycosylase YcaQ family protein [Candidatus Sulfotelmatobacter sp.]|nr:crosslink repair DNA glycosylase YcaQ family protein [Candidatus Sulfotelmatobacter sp.]